MQMTLTLDECHNLGYPLGLQDYPIYKEGHREELNKKIIGHYWQDRIGQETYELFYHFLNTKMSEIMPFYNQKYKSMDVEFNPLYNIDLTETFNRKNNTDGKNVSTSNSNVNNSTDTTDIKNSTTASNSDSSEFPQTLDDGTFDTRFKTAGGKNTSQNTEVDTLTNVVNSLSSGGSVSDTQAEEVEEYIKKTVGSSAGLSFSHAIQQWRDTMINIDMEIIDELKELFILLW